MRSVVLLCRHTPDEGSFGFVLNKLFEKTLDELIPELEDIDFPVYAGGPVQMDTLHYIHQYPQFFSDCQKISDGVYWGGDFETLKILLRANKVEASKIKFFLGYSGWGTDQLESELKEKSWLTVKCTAPIIFNTATAEIWKASLNELGGNYKLMAHFPTDPQLN